VALGVGVGVGVGAQTGTEVTGMVVSLHGSAVPPSPD
jgi:hypothetical protein